MELSNQTTQMCFDIKSYCGNEYLLYGARVYIYASEIPFSGNECDISRAAFLANVQLIKFQNSFGRPSRGAKANRPSEFRLHVQKYEIAAMEICKKSYLSSFICMLGWLTGCLWGKSSSYAILKSNNLFHCIYVTFD